MLRTHGDSRHADAGEAATRPKNGLTIPPRLTWLHGWKDLAWLRSRWPGKLIIKGILDEADDLQAAAAGADAIVVSNHGGRQLDAAPSTISVVPEIAARVELHVSVVWLDGGVRSGQDILKAHALAAMGGRG